MAAGLAPTRRGRPFGTQTRMTPLPGRLAEALGLVGELAG